MVLFARVQNGVVVNIETVSVIAAANDSELVKCPQETTLLDGTFNAALIGSLYNSVTGVFSPPPMSAQ